MMETYEAADLLPCPFCGCEAELQRLPDDLWYVQCNACQAATDQAEDADEAVGLWNQRVAQ